MKARIALITLTTALAFGLALPASAMSDNPAKDAKRLELLQANAGEARNTVKFLRPMHGYEVVGAQHLLVWETPHKAWLLDLRESAACNGLKREVSVGIEALYDTINTNNGYVVGDHGLRCRIEVIREVDVKAWKQAEREAGIRS